MKKPATTITLVMINIAAIGSLNNLPSLATAGIQSVGYYLIAVALFFVPYSLIVAELASAHPNESGIYVWVKNAFGEKWGFFAVWLQWLENLFWYPTILSFIAATLCYFVDPALASNKTYNLLATLGIYWGLTLANVFGMRVSALISLVGSSFGILVPGALLIGFGIYHFAAHHQVSHLALSWSGAFPHLNQYQNLAFLIGIIQTLAGLEMSTVHTKHVKNPRRAFPLATLISGLAVLVLSILGSLSIAVLVPGHAIDLNNGVAQAFQSFFQHNSFYQGILIILIAFGGMTAANAWISGPTTGLVQAARDRCIPACFSRVNQSGVSMPVLFSQGLIVSILCTAFIYMPTVSSAYWLLTAIAGQLYLMMYILMFAAAIKLRLTHTLHYGYRIAGHKTTVAISLFGLLSCIAFIAIGFITPDNLAITNYLSYHITQVSLFIAMLLIPGIIFSISRQKNRLVILPPLTSLAENDRTAGTIQIQTSS